MNEYVHAICDYDTPAASAEFVFALWEAAEALCSRDRDNKPAGDGTRASSLPPATSSSSSTAAAAACPSSSSSSSPARDAAPCVLAVVDALLECDGVGELGCPAALAQRDERCRSLEHLYLARLPAPARDACAGLVRSTRVVDAQLAAALAPGADADAADVCAAAAASAHDEAAAASNALVA
eukprot:Rhum_TRINITY_DN16120_c0_g1::Rhum_TRINITY_DN16120_c0_g1_i1::g.162810::m.162810